MGFADREKSRERKGVLAAMIENPVEQQTVTAEEKKGRPKAGRETKKRVSLVLLPSLYDKIQKIAYVERRSVSELVSECLTRYADENNNKLEEYNNIK